MAHQRLRRIDVARHPRIAVVVEAINSRGLLDSLVLISTTWLLTMQSAASADDCTPTPVRDMGCASGLDSPSGAQAYARDMLVADLGDGERLYVGGVFEVAGGVTTQGVAVFDGSYWSSLGEWSTDDSFRVEALLVWNDGTGPALYAVGNFTEMPGGVAANGIARWNGTEWSPLGSGVDGWGVCMVVHDDGVTGPCLYVGGIFKSAGGIEVGNIARWDGKQWFAVGKGMDDGVYGLTVHDDGGGAVLYACGEFTMADSKPAGVVARWNGETWGQVGDGIHWAIPSGLFPDAFSLSMLSDQGSFGAGPRLYMFGTGVLHQGDLVGGILQWDGSTWSLVGGGANKRAWWGEMLPASEDSGPRLIVAGDFSRLGGTSIPYLGAWDGTSWAAVGPPLDWATTIVRHINATASTPEGLYVGGGFENAGATGAMGIARLNGNEWFGLGSGVSGGHGANVTCALRPSQPIGNRNGIFFGGALRSVAGARASGIVQRVAHAWERVGESSVLPYTKDLSDMCEFDDGLGTALFVAGSFTSIDGVPCKGVARWNGESWSTVGALPPNGDVLAVVAFDDGLGGGPALYAGGGFTTIGGVSANRVARWDGASWTALGAGVDGLLRDLIVFDDGSGKALYAAGDFASAGGNPASRLAKWNGVSWSALGSGVNASVMELAATDDWNGSGPALFAGGSFTAAGTLTAKRVARWDGSAWSACGTIAGGSVYSLAVVDDADQQWLYAGGHQLSGPSVALIRWSGAEWQSIDLGFPNSSIVRMIYADPGDRFVPRSLYVGGRFEASSVGDSYLVRLELCHASCASDLSGDGVVDGTDLGALLSAWGDLASAADLDKDGSVDGNDLGTLLGAWGPCPP